jgi:hypothetical protein
MIARRWEEGNLCKPYGKTCTVVNTRCCKAPCQSETLGGLVRRLVSKSE